MNQYVIHFYLALCFQYGAGLEPPMLITFINERLFLERAPGGKLQDTVRLEYVAYMRDVMLCHRLTDTIIISGVRSIVNSYYPIRKFHMHLLS